MSSFKGLSGNPDVIGGGGGSGAPTDAKFYLQGMSASDPSMPNRRYLQFGTGLSVASGGPGGIDTVTNNNPTVFVDKSADGLQRWVQKSGSDADDGSVTHPKLTVASANTSLPPIVFGSGAGISIGPGLYATALNVLLNAAYYGFSKAQTLFDGGISFQAAALASSISCICNINFVNNPTSIDTSVCPGAIVLFDIDSFSTATTIADPAEPTTQLFFLMCVFGDSLTINGGSSLIFGQCVMENNITINSSAAQPIDAKFQSDAILGNVDINFTAGHTAMAVDLSSSMVDGNITITAGGAVAASVTVTLPSDYGTLTVTAAAGVVVFIDNGTTASGLVSNNGLTKTSFFAAAAPQPAVQIATTDALGNGIWDFPYQILFGGTKVITIADASSAVNGNLLTIVDDSGATKSAAYQPLSLVSVPVKDIILGIQSLVALNKDVSAANSSGAALGGTYDQFVYVNEENPQTVIFQKFPFNTFAALSNSNTSGAETRFMEVEITGGVGWSGVLETQTLTYDIDLFRAGVYVGHIARISTKELNANPDVRLLFAGTLVVQDSYDNGLWQFMLQWTAGDGLPGKTLTFADLYATFKFSPNNYTNIT